MKSRSVYRARPDHVAAAVNAREERGTWLMAGLYPSSMTAKLLAQQIPVGRKDPYTPAGEFEAYQAMHDDGYALWVRYVGGDEPVPELPDRMVVRVVNQGEGGGAGIVTVTVSTRCLRCGGPRGFDTVRPYRFPVNGVIVDADRWTNPCGHTDSHPAVLMESRERPLPVSVGGPAAVVLRDAPVPPAPDSPAGVVLAAANGWRVPPAGTPD
ncbi:hypothetical protein OG322_26155 [Streptomyces sp. NBC_01260]|uniref:hypothetical protein n=1 Tax=Streptomyces sp. NBC_01260 TaxID=2903801 RepID=UPI002E315F0C|nr:hypothetical protein [Streptomyces sp. NBC_01260]